MAAALENVILTLLNPTNEAQVEGFQNIQNLFKDPLINVSLCECMTVPQNPQVRRYAAVLLRRRLVKAKQWKRVTLQIKQGIKQTALQAFMKDNEKIVRNAIAELIGAIAKHDLPKGQWPELMELLNQSIIRSNVTDREIGLFVLSVITKTTGPGLKPHYRSLLSMLSKTLIDTSSPDVPYFTIKSLTSMVVSIGTEEMNMFQALVPSVMGVVKKLATIDEAKACEAMEIFDELIESEVAVIVPHIKPLIGMCLELAVNENLDMALRIKSVNIIRYLTRLKKKTIVKHKLVQPILDVVFPLMCHPCPGDTDNNDDDDEEDEQSLPTVSAQAIDMMALHLPPEKLIPPLMHFLEPALNSQDPHCVKAAYLALAVIAEGCSEYIRHKHLPAFVQVICKGIKEENSIVRNSALYSLGQYAEFLQPDVSKYAPEVLPIIFEYLYKTFVLLQQGNKNPPSLTKTFYALETFCENLEDGVLPYLPDLMNCLMSFLSIDTEKSADVKELAVRAIGSVAAAAKESFALYFDDVMAKLQSFINEWQTGDNMTLQIQAIDTLAIIARTAGSETFKPVAHDCVNFGLQLLSLHDDPDVRRATYNLFASVGSVLKSDMAPYLPTIVERMIVSIQSPEGISPHYTENNSGFTLFEDDDDDDDEEDDDGIGDEENIDQEEEDEDIAGYSVENAFMEEKESACCALKELSLHTGFGFLQYISNCFNEVKKLIECPAVDVRRAAIFAIGQFCLTHNQVYVEFGTLDHLTSLELKLGIFLPTLFSLSREDTERLVVLACLETLEDLLKTIKQNALNGNTLESVVALVKDVFKHKLACQDEEENEDDEAAEYDSMLMEYAGDITAILVKIVPSQQIAPYLAGLLPFLFSKTKKSCTVADKSFSIGTLADIVSCMEEGACKPFLTHFQNIFLSGMKDGNEEVRSNSVYGLGVLVKNATSMVYHQYPIYLQAMSTMLSQEDNPRAKDNICAAVARLIMANTSGVPLKQVFPVLLQCLPLKEDLEENSTVYKCLTHLYSIRCEELFQNLPQVLQVASDVLSGQKVEDETLAIIVGLVKAVHSEFPNDVEAVQKILPSANAEALMKAISIS